MVILVVSNGIRKYCKHANISYTLISNVKFISYSRCVLQTSNKFKIYRKKNNNDENVKEKLVYNSIIKTHNLKFEDKKIYLEEEEKLTKYKKEGAPVIALKYFTEEYMNGPLMNKQHASANKDSTNEEGSINQEINFPYKMYDHVEIDAADCRPNIVDDSYEHESNKGTDFSTLNCIKDRSCIRPKKSWMNDYNKYAEVSVKEEEEESDDENESSEVNYGSADPNIAASSVPCGGCGAHLHCKDPSIPGFLPKEIFAGQNSQQLQALVCQRCHFLQEYNTALSVTVDPAFYPQLLSQIRSQYALVILVVDMTDFPCSIWPGILDIIGPKRPLVVVGNKVDLLQDWSRDMLHRAKQSLEAHLPRKANVLHTALVSAKTGFGIEDLITALYNTWEYRGDVYLVGCTNVGKSMLFNALLQSDYCKTKAVDLVRRATTAPWPGTTLNLLKFPITRPEGWRLAVRYLRLKQESINDLRLAQEGLTQVMPQMISRINRTYSHSNIDHFADDYQDDPFAIPKLDILRQVRAPGSGLDPTDPALAKSKWLYDTPGVITSDQIIDLLTTEELMLTLPQEPLIPRSFTVWAGQSLLVGGLGRLDYISGAANIKMTVLAAATLPVTICFTVDVEEVYSHYLGSAALAVPCGGEERLRLWPGLQTAGEFTFKGTGWKESCGDVVLSSAGWVAVTAGQNNLVRLQPWTPEARGIHVRIPPVLPRAISVKGQRMFKSPAYGLFNDVIKSRRKK